VSAASQGSYQVRFDWGTAGRDAIAVDADAVVWVDQLGGDAEARTLEQADEIAEWALAEQERLGGRFRIAVVAAGAAHADGSPRFAVEDLLAAGAIIDAIAARGIDHQSPEAAAAAAAYHGLRNASRHLINASVSAREARDASVSARPGA
jgi:2-phosphosulfolactate phosphatase